ncbi:hypothetical protein BBP40_002283 [Aspergillus hancockii]|nr:hypothetical protein BBP40_002283 [Aspergillus hancockii]
MKQIKAVRIVTAGSKASAELRDEPLPSPGHHEVLIRVHAVSLNYRDMTLLRGGYRAEAKKDIVPVSDGAGEVVAVGKDVPRVKTGDRVAVTSASVDGMLAEYVLFYEDALVHIPDYMSYIEAASLPCAAVTAWTALNKIGPPSPIFGARVLTIMSSDEKAAKLKELGAESVVNYSTCPDWDREILALTDGKGVDKVLDIAGEKTIVKPEASAKATGVVVLIGFASGFGGGLPLIDILVRSLPVTGSTVCSRMDFEAMLKALGSHKVRLIIDRAYPFAEYRVAYRRLEGRQQVGKVVIEVAH